jgi:hypothetical protein
MTLHCVDCGQDFVDLATYQSHVHREDPLDPARGVALGCALGLIAWAAIIVGIIAVIRACGGPEF